MVHKAPVDKSCAQERDPVAGQGACGFEMTEDPADWNALSVESSAWPQATEHSERALSPKDGYDRITWDSNAQLICGRDLETDNTLLCRLVIEQDMQVENRMMLRPILVSAALIAHVAPLAAHDEPLHCSAVQASVTEAG